MTPDDRAAAVTPSSLARLKLLADSVPTAKLALAEAAMLRAKCTLPKGVTHVISDVHGEDGKLRHVINNASGSLRPLVEQIFADRLTTREQRQLLALIYYPREAMRTRPELADLAVRAPWVRLTLRQLFEIIRHLSGAYPREEIRARIPEEYRHLYRELLVEPFSGRPPRYVDEMLAVLSAHEADLDAVHNACRLVRNLAVSEIIVAGDLGDRGPRMDRVIEFLKQQPKVALVWGNHDVTWLGACLGHEALIATVLRMSLRYQRLWQLEEGYGIILSPLEKLARDVYGDDPARRFLPHGAGGLRSPEQVARMHKAAAILEFKLTESMIRRHPEWGMDDRLVLDAIDPRAGTVTLNGSVHPLLDANLPTLDPNHVTELSPDEKRCIDRLRESFVGSARLWDHMSWVVRHGSMATVRDHVAIFHACVPVDASGEPLAVEIDGRTRAGKALFDALDGLVRRAYRKTASHLDVDADWFWWMWAGPRSPLFGKDKMTTFERYFVGDASTHKEAKNPYFRMINDADFTRRIAAEMGVDAAEALVVNGHVPVQPEKGELPIKQGGNAVTIDGAFSEVYGDRGYTLVLSPDRVSLAEHHHFESVEEVIQNDADIVPRIATVCEYSRPRLVADTEEGAELVERALALEELATAYRHGLLRERA
ncbi:MAG: fructose-bisphosphatase class III [Verrucomicrobiales bacterium]